MIGIKQKHQVLSFQAEQTVNRKISGFRAALVRPTKISKRAEKRWADFKKITYFKNKNKKFQKFVLIKSGLLVQFSSENFFLERFNQFSMWKSDFENQNFEMFEEVVHKFGNLMMI